jgi:hypothetical protein
MPDQPTATAVVATATPGRYAKQLASHFGRRCELVEEAGGTRIVFGDGSCLVQPREDTLDLEVSAPTGDEVERLTQVVGSHLERFGQRNELTVRWIRTTEALA